jgi:hypothetical protein
MQMNPELAVRMLQRLVREARAEYESIAHTRAKMRPSERAMALASRAEEVMALEMGASAIIAHHHVVLVPPPTIKQESNR